LLVFITQRNQTAHHVSTQCQLLKRPAASGRWSPTGLANRIGNSAALRCINGHYSIGLHKSGVTVLLSCRLRWIITGL